MAKQNTFEGGVNGTSVTAANSGGASGDAISVPVIGTGGSIQYTSTLPWGSGKGAVINNGTGATYIRWDDDTNTDTRVVFRRPLWIGAELGGVMNLAIFYATGSAMGALVLEGPGGNVRKPVLQNASFVTQAGSRAAAALSLNHLYWVEFAVRSSGHSSGAGLEYRILDTDGVTQVATYDLAVATNANPANRVRIGANTTTAIAADYLDDIRWEAKASGWLGPLAAEPPTLTLTNVPRQIIDARGSSVPTGSIDYTIAQETGPTTAPEQFGAGVWAVTPHATETLTYEITANGSLGGSDAETITVPPAGSGTSGPAGPYIRERTRVGGVLV